MKTRRYFADINENMSEEAGHYPEPKKCLIKRRFNLRVYHQAWNARKLQAQASKASKV
jgi:hypothetical protein